MLYIILYIVLFSEYHIKIISSQYENFILLEFLMAE